VFVGMLKNGFNLNKMLATSAIEEGKRAPEDLAKALRDAVPLRNTPPLAKPEDVLSDTVVHFQDIRRAVGEPGSIPEERLRLVLDRMAATGSIMGNKKRIAGLRLSATDIDWTHGTGPEVRGTGEALLMALCGRSSAIDDLTGEGVTTLRSR